MPLAHALVHEEDGNFGISFPDFPGCISGGASAEDAIRKGSEALTFHAGGMDEDGDPMPVLRTLNELQRDPAFIEALAGAVLALVPFELPSKAVRINISIDENLLGAVDAAAKAAGMSRSSFLAEAARKRIRAA